MYTARDRAFADALTARFGNDYEYVGAKLSRWYGGERLYRGVALARYVVHHLGGGSGWSADDVWRFHVGRLGWSTVGYNVLIDADARVEVLIPPSSMTYGAGPRWNPSSAHVALAGNFERANPSAAQLDALYGVLCALDDCYAPLPWRGHSELKATACPGRHLMPHVRWMRGALFGDAARYGRIRPSHYGSH